MNRRWRTRTSLVGAAGLALGLALGCRAPASPAPVTPEPGPGAVPDVLVEPRLINPDFVWRQKLHARYAKDSFDFEAIVEKSDNVLRVLFLTPYGTRALLLEQLGPKVRTEYFVDHRLPFPADYILGDIHRVYFRGFEGGPPADGVHTQDREGEVFRDTWRGGVLVARTVTPRAAPSAAIASAPSSAALSSKNSTTEPGSIAIRYMPGYRPGAVPDRVQLNNTRHGYQIVIETLPN